MGSGAARDEGDAVSAVATGRDGRGAAALGSAAGDAAPVEGRAQAELSRRADERKAIEKEIEDLSKQRTEYLKTKGGGAGFDNKVKETIDRQLSR
jgi:hypothetical protein